MSNRETVDQVLKGYQMNPPDKCPNEISQLMIKCWSDKPEDRPSFQVIYQ